MNKLRRPGTHFELGALDDIGGCRVIVDSPSQVDQVVLVLKTNLGFKGRNPEKDYIREPQKSGYRSYHLFAVAKMKGRGIGWRFKSVPAWSIIGPLLWKR